MELPVHPTPQTAQVDALESEARELSDARALRFPVSIKGVVFVGSKVVLLRNEREEWELPGGKLDENESPTNCVAREIQEELGIEVTVDRILDSWVYRILDRIDVLIVTYLCRPRATIESTDLVVSSEHKEVGLFAPHELGALRLPAGYRESITRALSRSEI